MAAPVLLTLDLGTTNCKAAAFALDGRQLAATSVAHPTLNPVEGRYEQRPSDWRSAVTLALRSVAETLGARAGEVAGLALSAWGPGLVLLGDDGEPLLDASPTWQDTRSLEDGRQLVRDAGSDWVGGGMPLTGFPAKLGSALRERPELSAEAAFAVGVKDYMLYWLTGVLATEPSSGPFAPDWPPAVFAALGWELTRLPPVVASTAVIGTLQANRASELCLPAGLPVVAGLNDGAAATLGVGAHSEGDVVVSLGTNGVVRFVTETPPSGELCLSHSLFRYPLLEGFWACGGFVLAGGSALAWLADASAPSGVPAELPELLDEAALIPPGSDGVVFLPYLVGRGAPYPDPDAAAAFLGLRLRHHRGHLTRAVLEGVAFEIREIAEMAAAQGIAQRRLLLTGGGAASTLWREIISDVLRMPAVYRQGDSNLGLAVVLALALGLASDWGSAAARLLPEAERTETTAASRGFHEEAYRASRAAAERHPGVAP